MNDQNQRRQVRTSMLEGVLDTLIFKPIWDEERRESPKSVEYRLGQIATVVAVSSMYVIPVLYDYLTSRDENRT